MAAVGLRATNEAKLPNRIAGTELRFLNAVLDGKLRWRSLKNLVNDMLRPET